MKTQIWRKLLGATLVAVAILTMPANATEGADEPKAPATTNAAPTEVLPASTNAPAVSTAVATNSDTAQVFQWPRLGLPPVLDQVVKLSQSGMDEAVVRAYIEKAAPAYRITGNEIVQLRDLGISQEVIMALIDHSQTAEPANVTEVTAPQTQAPPEPAMPPQTNAQAQAVVASGEAAADFYDALSPYGAWLDVPGYGWCWQPTVVVVNSDWRPYSDGGYWLWSDSGWYWHSYYSWGWAPFHYGRWFCPPNRGWVWCPDRVWGPSWVCWRNSATHCGWAPLPPGACFTAGVGWTHHGRHVGVSFGFGIAAGHFTFVAHDRFSDRHVSGHALRGHDAAAAYRNTTVVNNYAVGANNRFINHGVGRETIAAASRTPIREVAVRDLPRGRQNLTMPDRVSRVGNSEVVFRPGEQISAVPRPATASTGFRSGGNQLARQTMATRSTASSGAAVAQRAQPVRNTANVSAARPQRTMGTVSSAQRTVSASPSSQRTMPNYSQGFVNRGGAVQPNRGLNTTSSLRANSVSQYQGRSFARPTTPAVSQRSNGSVQRYNAPSANRSVVNRSAAPSIGRAVSAPATRSVGNVSRSAGTAGRSSVVRR